MMTDWQTVRIDQMGRVVTGKTPPSERPDEFGDVYPFVTPSDIPATQKHIEVDRYLSERGMESHKRIQLPSKSVCVVCIGATIGKTCMTGESSISNQQINSIIPFKGNFDPDFVYYISTTLKDSLVAFAGGSATPIINKSTFSSIRLLVPCFEEQQKIASILSAYDDLIENNQRRIALLEKMAEEIYREWFVRMRFPGHEKVKKVKGVPENWNPVLIGDLLERIPPGKKYEQKTAAVTGRVPILDQGQTGVIGFHDNEPGVIASPEKPVVVFANHTCYQRLIFFPFSAIQNVLPFIPSTTKRSNIFWLHMATKGAVELSEYKGHWPAFVTKRIYYPGVDLAEKFGNIAAPLFKQRFQIENANEVLIKLRDALLPRLISGKLSVEHLDIQFPPSMEATA